MYRMFCESFKNYKNNFNGMARVEEYRSKITEPLKLLVNSEMYAVEKCSETMLFKRLNDLLIYMEENMERYPKLKAFLWTLESRGIKGFEYGMATHEELEEQTKIINSILNLQYWEN